MQTPHLTPHERSILRATGFPIPAQGCPAPAAQETLDLALRSLEAPSPRASEASTYSLKITSIYGDSSEKINDFIIFDFMFS
jgi:hypothetical protein